MPTKREITETMREYIDAVSVAIMENVKDEIKSARMMKRMNRLKWLVRHIEEGEYDED